MGKRVVIVGAGAEGASVAAEVCLADGTRLPYDTLSCALWAGLGLDDVGWLDLAYSPPVGGSWDLIHIAAQALKRKL
jgi:hypothetical protein